MLRSERTPMAPDDRTQGTDGTRSPTEELSQLFLTASEEQLRSLLDRPSLDETHILLLLERKDLTTLILAEIAKKKALMSSYRIRRAMAMHPRAPRLAAQRALRDLHLMDLVRLSLLPSAAAELKRMAEERILTQLLHLPLGQRITLARRGSARVAAGLIQQGPDQVARIALDNPFLNEAQLLKTLSRDSLPAGIVSCVARHEKWPKFAQVRVALLRHPHLSPEHAPHLASDLPRGDLEDLLGLARLSESVRSHLRAALQDRQTQK